MKKYNYSVLVIIMLFIANRSIYAQQISPEIAKRYSKDILIKVYEIASKVALSNDKQLQIAEQLKTQNEILSNAIIKGMPIKSIDSLISNNEIKINSLMSVQQLNQYNLAARKNNIPSSKSNNKFSLAINNAKQLSLTGVQIDSLNANITTLQGLISSSKKLNEKFDSQAYETAHLSRILSQAQYDVLLLVNCTPTAIKWASSDWKDIKRYGLSQGLDSVKTVNQILNYDRNRLFIKEKYKNNPNQLDASLRSIDDSMPDILRKLKASKRYNNPTGVNAKSASKFVW